MKLVKSLLIVLLAISFAKSSEAFEVPPNDGFVTDTTGILSADQEAQLEKTLDAYSKETSNDIAILIVETLDGEPISDLAVDIGRKWGVGQKEFNNGIMIVIAYADRQIFIATGYGLEGAVPDIVAKGVIDREITPYFKHGDYYGGIAAGIESLKKHIGGEYTADRYKNKRSDGGDKVAFLFFFCFILLQWLSAIFARSKSWWLGGIVGAIAGIILVIIKSWWISIPILTLIGLLLDYVVSKNYKKRRGKASWWAGGGGGKGGSSGGFGGFSGGSFGGGGAGGSW